MKYAISCLILLMNTFFAAAFASQPLTLGELKYAGNGCPMLDEHTTIIHLSDSSVSIIPTEMTLMTPTDERTIQRKKCDIALGVSVAAGYQVGIQQASLLAFAVLDTNSTAEVTLHSGFSGQSFTKASEKFSTDSDQNVEIKTQQEQWAKCGQDVIIRAKTSAILRSDSTQNAYIRVNGMILDLSVRPCKE